MGNNDIMNIQSPPQSFANDIINSTESVNTMDFIKNIGNSSNSNRNSFQPNEE